MKRMNILTGCLFLLIPILLIVYPYLRHLYQARIDKNKVSEKLVNPLFVSIYEVDPHDHSKRNKGQD